MTECVGRGVDERRVEDVGGIGDRRRGGVHGGFLLGSSLYVALAD